jgi:hypothetical protein
MLVHINVSGTCPFIHACIFGRRARVLPWATSHGDSVSFFMAMVVSKISILTVSLQGAIQTVMLAMTAHPDSESCQTYACSCLNLLVRDPEVQHLVDHEAGIACTLKMLQTWSQSEQVRTYMHATTKCLQLP